MSLTLTARLQMVASLVRSNRLTVDVGTDHGYLPAFLVMSGKTRNAAASDIGEGPLMNAKKTISRYCLENKITPVLSDGLSNIPRNTEEIIIAGMGGELIAEILQKAQWIKNDRIHLVLQPMSHSAELRKFLCENGFYIDDEKFCCEDKRDYMVFSVYYSGKDEKKDLFYYYFGDKLKSENPIENRIIDRQYRYLQSRFMGLHAAGQEIRAQYYKNISETARKKFGL